MRMVIIFEATKKQKDTIGRKLTELSKTVHSEIAFIKIRNKKVSSINCEKEVVNSIERILNEMGIQVKLCAESQMERR